MDLTALPLAPIGAMGALMIAVLLVLRGHLIPRQVHEDRMKDKDQQIEWYRLGYEREVVRNGELTEQVGLMMEVARTTDHVIRALPGRPHEAQGSTNELASS